MEITKETKCSPLAMEAAVPAEIGRLRWLFRSGKEWERKRGSPGLDLWPKTGREGARRRLAEVESGVGRWSFGSGEGEAPAVASNGTGRWCGVMWSC
jgi:hypothetical protein